MLKKILKDKRAILVISLLALFSLVLLASIVRDVSFHPARRFTQEEAEVVRIPIGDAITTIADVPLEKQITFLVFLFLLGVLVISLLSPEMRKRLLKQLFRVAVSVALLLYLLKIKPDLLAGLFPDFSSAGGQPVSPSSAGVPPPTFETPQVSGWISFVVTLGIVLLVAVFLWRVNRRWAFIKQKSEPHPLADIAGIARASLQNLSSGQGSAQDKIIQCYADMSRVVVERRNLHRDYAMTPSEFAVRLEKAGLPREPVKRLTHLFESVRYGARISAQDDVDEAIACLTSILKYCGEST
jgi:hypothetical protein